MTSLSRAFIHGSLGVLLAYGAVAPAVAAPIVSVGSSYSFRVTGTDFAGFTLGNLLFDGAAELRNVDGRALTISESQQDLGNGSWKIALSLTSDVDLSPGDTIAFSFGHEDAIDLLQTVSLAGLRLQIAGFDAQGRPAAANPDVLSLLSPQFRAPWTGAVADPPSGAIAFVGLPWDVRSVSFEMTVASVPEPGLPMLVGSALAALALTRRRSPRPPGR